MSTVFTNQAIARLARQFGTPLLVLDCNVLRRQYDLLHQALPGVDFFYAVKAFPHAAVINTLNQCGTGFDLASSGEIDLVRSQFINPRHTIHTHPIKKDQDIRHSLRFGCTTFVIDNRDELKKFLKYRQRVGLLLRLSFPNPDAVVDLSRKFGCSHEEAPELLRLARSMGMHIKGLSFHAGSQSHNPAAHGRAIEHCAGLIADYNRYADNPMSTLDIGGGFPVNYSGSAPDIEAFCAPLRAAIERLDRDIHVIAEPGRFLVAPAAVSVTSVTGKTVRGGRTWYYLDDGVYGAYSGMIYDHARYPIRCLKRGRKHPAVLAGPTCDSIDIISDQISLPALEVGDVIIGEMMGAYTAASATDFNSLSRSRILVLNEPEVHGKVVRIA